MSLFQTLKHAAENYCDIDVTLENVRTNCEQICNQSRAEFKSKFGTAKSPVDEIEFSVQLETKRLVGTQNERRKCSPEEYELIENALTEKQIPFYDAKHIKYSLGFLANGYASKYKKPCVAFVGQKNAGKSSLINCLLQAKVAPHKVTQQIRVTYCPVNFVAHMKDSKLINIELGVSDEDLNASTTQDRNRKQGDLEIIIGTAEAAAKNGFDIVETSALNPAPNELCAMMERSILPLLIYVIEGRKGLTQKDINSIQQIRSQTPKLKIMYFVTKLDRSKLDKLKYDERKEKSKLKEGEDFPGESDMEVAEKILNENLLELKQCGFLPLSTKIEGSPDFHGADVCRVDKVKTRSPDSTINSADEFSMRLIKHFEEHLMLYLKDKLENSLKEKIECFLSSIERVLEKVNLIRSEVNSQNMECKDLMNLYKDAEKALFDSEKYIVEQSIRGEIDKLIECSEQTLVKLISEINMKLSSTKKNGPELSDDKIKEFVETSLNEEIEDFIKNFMVQKEERLREKLLQKVNNIIDKYQPSSFELALRNQLLQAYGFSADFSLPNSNLISCKSTSQIEKLMKSFGQLNTEHFKLSSTNTTPSHKENRAGENDGKIKHIIIDILRQFDIEKFVSTFCGKVTEEFVQRHERFERELISFLQFNFTIGKEEKLLMESLAENLALQYIIMLHLKTPLYIMIDPLKPIDKISKGGHGQVEKVFILGANEPIVRKQYKQTFKDFTNSERLLRISMEIYYSSRLDHPRCLKLLGLHFEDFGEGWQFTAYYPYLEIGCLKKFIKVKNNRRRVSLYERVKLCLEIAEGVQLLHKLNIVHRDINPKNILIRGELDNQHTVEAVLSDYGLTKSFGFIENTERIGAPLYMAPELFQKKELSREDYTAAVDVFSFAVCMWQLLSYNLIGEYSNYYPRFAIECEHNKRMIEKLVKDGERPEERSKIPPPLYLLIRRCWDGQPDKRPSFIKTIRELGVEFDENDHMKDKTIVDCLNEFLRGMETTSDV